MATSRFMRIRRSSAVWLRPLCWHAARTSSVTFAVRRASGADIKKQMAAMADKAAKPAVTLRGAEMRLAGADMALFIAAPSPFGETVASLRRLRLRIAAGGDP